MRVMLDTNILVSVIFFPSDDTRAFIHTLCKSHEIVLCDYVIKELELVVERKFPSKAKALEEFISTLPFCLVHTDKVLDTGNLSSIRDGKDLPILATAVRENIEAFVTGDKDFLVLDIKHPEILTMTQFRSKYSKFPHP